MNFSNLNKSIENRYKNNLNESLEETKKVSKFINKLNESQILSERKWQLTIPGTYRKAIFDAGEEEDFEGVRIALVDICDFVLSHLSEIESGDDKEYVQEEFEDFKEELEYIDIEDEDEANYWLNDLYDLLDNTDIFLGINESLNEEIHPNIKMVQDRYDDAVAKGLEKQAKEILSDNLIDVKKDKCIETSVNSNTEAAYFALRRLLKESLYEADYPIHLMKHEDDIDEGIDIESTGIRRMPLYAAIKANKKFNQEAKKYPYWVIETSKWYDPEGLNIENNDFKIQFAGDYNECADWLSKLIGEAKADTDTYVIEEEGKDFVKLYYPHAISKTMFSIKKNDNIQNESLEETVPGGDYFEPGIENANDNLDDTINNYEGEEIPFDEFLNESLPEEIKKDIDRIVKTHGIKSIPKWQIQDIAQDNPEYSKEIWNYVSDLEYPDDEELEEDIDFSSPIGTSFDYLHEKEAMDYQLIEPLINFFDGLENNYKCNITWNFGRRLSDDKMTAGVDVYFSGDFDNEDSEDYWLKKDEELLDRIRDNLSDYGFELDSSLGYDRNPWKEHMMGKGYHTQIIEIEDVDECLTEAAVEKAYWVTFSFGDYSHESTTVYANKKSEVKKILQNQYGKDVEIHSIELDECLNEERKPKYWNSMFAQKVIDAYEKGDLTFDNIKEWDKNYNGGIAPNPPFNTGEILKYYLNHDKNLSEDTIKQNNKWVNKGKEGTHGTFKTKKEADAQRRAMFANDFKG